MKEKAKGAVSFLVLSWFGPFRSTTNELEFLGLCFQVTVTAACKIPLHMPLGCGSTTINSFNACPYADVQLGGNSLSGVL